MKQIIPFKKELLFQTKVSEITSISLEHTLSLKNDNLISGEFHINGDYKMTEGSINREKFSFRLPFEITLASRYNTSSMVIDIDNFYYEVINNEALQINIDVFMEGEKIEEPVSPPEANTHKEEVPIPSSPELEEKKEQPTQEIGFPDLSDFITKDSPEKHSNITTSEESYQNISKESAVSPEEREEPPERNIHYPKIENINFEKEMKEIEELEKQNEGTSSEPKLEFNLFENMESAETYVTYHVYIIKETDTLDTILKKYEVSKEDLSLYNNIDDIKPGMKLIIPNKNE